MGKRSYLLTEQHGQYDRQLQANTLPLLWVATAGPAHVQQLVSLDEDPAAVTVPLADALANLRRRRALVDRWLGSPGASVLDQLAQLLRQSQAERVHLALGDWAGRHESAEAMLATLRQAVEALDSDPSKGTPKRWPAPVKWLMDEFGLAGAESPLSAPALAGARNDDGGAPWRPAPSP